MHKIQTEVLVIGGGATGTGVAWDAALRGFKVVLVERRDLNHGTTGRYHGLLHSGGRYAVKDPYGAAECIAENRILRLTHTHCIEDTSGFFVVTPEDEGDFPDQFKSACDAVGIPCVEIPVSEALSREPLLNPRISRVFEVPDGSADSFLAAHSTVQAARQKGAQILTYHEVVGLIVEGTEDDRRVVGARVYNTVRGEITEIYADIVVNAAGAWTGKIATMAGGDVLIMPAKGTMVGMAHRLVNTVINRCKMPSDGDILVPSHTICVIGTTSINVTDPEHLRIEPWEVKKMLDAGDKMVPGFKNARVLRAWAGVRPLFQDTYKGAGGRDVTRKLTLLDHSEREGIKGFLTITGGKWTTFRLMAEATVDKVCEHLDTERPCATATTPVPGVDQGHYWVGHRLHEIEEKQLQGELICECELVTRKMLVNAARQNPTLTLDDLRRDVRLGMGPCQGGFCTYRAAGILHELQKTGAWPSDMLDNNSAAAQWNTAYLQSPSHNLDPDVVKEDIGDVKDEAHLFNPNLLLRDFLQERWKGLVPVLWGRQLKQERLSQLIYMSLMNADHLPDSELASPVTDFYRFDTTPGLVEPDATL
ncbi:MAG: anaerobic glycerol-3-phosphate dehydrogenase subunit A [Chloroflexi bacterium]|jgi:glycerol-3-phosphate dehydrogenase|nr:anaerobic glycerol-3-phosphate dehydrogenase subunit A [Chloroflexota bacterium]